ncbi:MAG: Calx-beta domain-containing protein [Desulfobacca sp.]|nr:Calx-beta domain-containing protein [Desulfobacca sp.]
MRKSISVLVIALFLLIGSVGWANAAPKLSFSSGTVTVAENVSGGKLNLTVTMSKASDTPVMVKYRVEDVDAQIADHGTGQDYNLANGSEIIGTTKSEGNLVFAPGETSATITIRIIDDEVVEMDEKFRVVLEGPQGADLGIYRCYVTIMDDDRDIFINVKDPPAGLSACVGDGIEDDTPAIQAILDWVKNNCATYYGALLYFPAGTYKIRNPGTGYCLNVPITTNNITLLGVNSPYTKPDREQSKLLFEVDKYDIEGLSKANPCVVTITGHGLKLGDKITLNGIRQEEWSDLTDGSPLTKNYSFRVKEVINANSFAIMDKDGVNVDTSGFTEAYNPTSDPGIMEKAGDRNRFIGCSSSYSGDTDSWRFCIRNMTVDQSYIGNGNWDYEQRQCIIFGQSYTTATGHLRCAIQDCKIKNSQAGGFQGHGRLDAYIYKVIGDHNFRGLVVMSGGGFKLFLKDVTSYGSGFCAGGLDVEVDPPAGDNMSCLLDMRDFSVFGGKFQIGMRNGDSSYTPSVYCERVFVDKSLKVGLENITFRAGIDTVGTFKDCVFYIDTDSLGTTGNWYSLNFDNCTFIAYAQSEPVGDWVFAFALHGVEGPTGPVFNNCTFKADTRAKHDYLDKQWWGFKLYKLCSDTHTFNNCTFEDSLDGGIWYPDYGGPEIIVNDCIFNNECRKVGGVQTTNILFSGRNDWGKYAATINSGIFNSPYFAKFHGWKTVNAADCVLKLNNVIVNKANSDIVCGSDQPPWTNTFIPLYGAMHPEAMPRSGSGGPTTISYANHGLVSGDKIMWDRVTQDGWKAGLSPDSNVPIFTVTKIDDDNFTINLDTSGYAADYDPNTDAGVFWKHPGLRIIQGEEGDNPTVSPSPAGLAGDRYDAGGTYYRCSTSGKAGQAVWEAE